MMQGAKQLMKGEPHLMPTTFARNAFKPYPSVFDFWKVKIEKLSSTNWIFNLQKSILKLIFAGYTGSKIQFEID